MPSLEFVCIGQDEPIKFSQLSFTVEAEKELVSHRRPQPLFQSDFDKLQGCIYHLLDERDVTAFDLFKRDWYGNDSAGDETDINVEFRTEYVDCVKVLLRQLIMSSPTHQLLFTTDYQFGPDEQRFEPISLAEFWEIHEAGKLCMNALYSINSLD